MADNKVKIQKGQGRTEGMVIAKAEVNGKHYSSGFWTSPISALRQLVFKKQRGFSNEREAETYKRKDE